MPPMTSAEKKQAERERKSEGGRLLPVTVYISRNPKAKAFLMRYVARLNHRMKDEK